MALALKILLIVLLVAIAVGLVVRVFRRPSNTPPVAVRQRMPKIVPLVGGLLTAIGFFLGLAGFLARLGTDPVPLRIGSVVVLLAGLLMLIAYRNRFVQPGRDAVRFRTVLGRESAMAYRDVTAHELTEVRGRPRLILHGSDGTTLRLDPSIYDLKPAFDALGYTARGSYGGRS